jgi:rRNA maturation RNase YbeY
MPASRRSEKVSEEMVRRWATAALRVMGKADCVAEFFFFTDRKMKQLELATMGKVKPVVDVLSFPNPAGFPAPHMSKTKRHLGEIFLNENLRKDAPRVRHLVIHGLLHLSGYTHEEERDTIRMQREEDRILAAISRT